MVTNQKITHLNNFINEFNSLKEFPEISEKYLKIYQEHGLIKNVNCQKRDSLPLRSRVFNFKSVNCQLNKAIQKSQEIKKSSKKHKILSILALTFTVATITFVSILFFPFAIATLASIPPMFMGLGHIFFGSGIILLGTGLYFSSGFGLIHSAKYALNSFFLWKSSAEKKLFLAQEEHEKESKMCLEVLERIKDLEGTIVWENVEKMKTTIKQLKKIQEQEKKLPSPNPNILKGPNSLETLNKKRGKLFKQIENIVSEKNSLKIKENDFQWSNFWNQIENIEKSLDELTKVKSTCSRNAVLNLTQPLKV